MIAFKEIKIFLSLKVLILRVHTLDSPLKVQTTFVTEVFHSEEAKLSHALRNIVFLLCSFLYGVVTPDSM